MSWRLDGRCRADDPDQVMALNLADADVHDVIAAAKRLGAG